MSTRRKLERSINRSAGEDSAGGMMLVSELRAEAAEMAERLLKVAFAIQPVNPGAALLALEVVRRHVVLLVDEADQSVESKARFWASMEAEFAAYDEAVKASRS